MKYKSVYYFWLGLFIVVLFLFMFFSVPTETKYKYSNGIYCVPNKGLIYLGGSQVPSGAILVKPEPDYTNGEYLDGVNLNLLKMMGCYK